MAGSAAGFAGSVQERIGVVVHQAYSGDAAEFVNEWSFQVRVVASSPSLPAVPSNLFLITTQVTPSQADVSLAMTVDQPAPDLNTPVTVNVSVRNDGPNQADGVIIRDRLPANLTFLSSTDFSVANAVLTSSVLSLVPGSTRTLRFIAQPTALGSFFNAAEVAQATTQDPDSQPNSGTGDGQDDVAQIGFRTRQGGGGFFGSPNPNQVPLPSVVGNQPTPDPAKADVSINLTVDNRTPTVNGVISYSLIVTNQGGLSATGLTVKVYLPDGQTFVAGDDFGSSGSDVVSSVSSVAAGSSIVLRFRAIATRATVSTCRAELTAAGVPDPDSTPNNGTANGEDDTAQVDVRVRY